MKTIVIDSVTAFGQYYMDFVKERKMDRDELLTVMDKWSLEELDTYIEQLEIRITYNRGLIQDLKAIRRKKMKKLTPDNGTRGGE